MTLSRTIEPAPGIPGGALTISSLHEEPGMIAERLGDPAGSERHLRAALDHETRVPG